MNELKDIKVRSPVYVIKKRGVWPWIIVGIVFIILLGILFASLTANIALLRGEERAGIISRAQPRISEFLIRGEGAAKIAVIPVEGFIGLSRTEGWWGRESMVQLISAGLDKAEKDNEVKAVILKINSPGGGITAADVIHHRLKDFQAVGKKVVALLEGLAASGGYYIACPADRIVAHPTTITGSFGVIIQTFNLEGLMRKLGIGDVTIKAGEQKDLLSPFRSLSPEERRLLQEVVDEMHQRFIQVIVEGRGLDEETVRKFADGRIFTAPQALDLKLIDEIGYENEAIDTAQELTGIKEARVVEYRSVKSFWDIFRVRIYRLFASSPARELKELFLPSSPRLLYLWSIY